MNKVIFELNDGTTKEFDGEKFTDEQISKFNIGRCFEIPCEECHFNSGDCIEVKGFLGKDVVKCYRVTEESKPVQILKRLIEGGSVWVDGAERKLEHLSIDGSVCSQRLDYKSVTLEKPKKRIKVDLWLNVYPSDNAGVHESKESADKHAAKNRIACEHFVKEYEV